MPQPENDCAPERPGRGARRTQVRLRLALWVLGLAAGAAGLPALAALRGTMTTAPPWALALAGLLAAAWVLHPLMKMTPGMPVLVWRSVSHDPHWLPWGPEVSITPAQFDRQLTLLGRMGRFAITTREMVAVRSMGSVLRGAVVLHFDGGLLDNRLAAWPLLRHHGMRATLFVSSALVEPASRLRPTADIDPAPRWAGYLNWDELREMDASPEWEIESQGCGRTRVEIGPRVVERLTAANWRRLAWVQWAAPRGLRPDWWRKSAPWAVPLGAPVRESAPALSAPAWDERLSRRESPESYRARVARTLAACNATFTRELGRQPRIFGWPDEATSPAARRLAAAAGYRATTGGFGRNVPSEGASILSRVEVRKNWVGIPCRRADDLGFVSTVRLVEGNLYWALPIGLLALCRRLLHPLNLGP